MTFWLSNLEKKLPKINILFLIGVLFPFLNVIICIDCEKFSN